MGYAWERLEHFGFVEETGHFELDGFGEYFMEGRRLEINGSNRRFGVFLFFDDI